MIDDARLGPRQDDGSRVATVVCLTIAGVTCTMVRPEAEEAMRALAAEAGSELVAGPVLQRTNVFAAGKTFQWAGAVR